MKTDFLFNKEIASNYVVFMLALLKLNYAISLQVLKM